MSTPDRTRIIALLERLGDDDDTQVLSAARELHTAAREIGIEWGELLAANDSEPVSLPAPMSELDDSDAAAAVAMINRLLARDELSDLTRDEIVGYKNDITEGDFTTDDLRYLQALEARLDA